MLYNKKNPSFSTWIGADEWQENLCILTVAVLL